MVGPQCHLIGTDTIGDLARELCSDLEIMGAWGYRSMSCER
jgi:hypothetical protein